MIWLVTCALAVVVGVVVAVAASRGEAMQPVEPDRRDVHVPADRPLGARDLEQVRFTTALRGYRMDEVDALLARLQLQLPDSVEDPPEAPRAG